MQFPEGGYTSSGACLLVALYASERNELVVANVGDSRAILALPATHGAEVTAVSLTRDQTAGDIQIWLSPAFFGERVGFRVLGFRILGFRV